MAAVPDRNELGGLLDEFGVIVIPEALLFAGMGLLYVIAPVQLCNNYVLLEQIALGWGFLTTAVCMVVYFIYHSLTRHSAYE